MAVLLVLRLALCQVKQKVQQNQPDHTPVPYLGEVCRVVKLANGVT